MNTPTHSTEKPTPRTDAAVKGTPGPENRNKPRVLADFARQLERELIAATTPTAEQIEACAREINREEYLRRNLACAKACGAVAGLDKLRAQLNTTKYQPAWLKKALFEVAKRIEPLPAELATWRDSSPDSPYLNRQ